MIKPMLIINLGIENVKNTDLGLLDVLVVVLPQVVDDEVGDLAVVFVRKSELLLGGGGLAVGFGLEVGQEFTFRPGFKA